MHRNGMGRGVTCIDQARSSVCGRGTSRAERRRQTVRVRARKRNDFNRHENLEMDACASGPVLVPSAAVRTIAGVTAKQGVCDKLSRLTWAVLSACRRSIDAEVERPRMPSARMDGNSSCRIRVQRVGMDCRLMPPVLASSREDVVMKSTPAPAGALRSSAPIVSISALYAAARHNARRRAAEGWCAAALVGLVWTFVGVFAWNVLGRAATSLIAP